MSSESNATSRLAHVSNSRLISLIPVWIYPARGIYGVRYSLPFLIIYSWGHAHAVVTRLSFLLPAREPGDEYTTHIELCKCTSWYMVDTKEKVLTSRDSETVVQILDSAKWESCPVTADLGHPVVQQLGRLSNLMQKLWSERLNTAGCVCII